MKISKSSLTYLARSGYMTLQVPQYTISLGRQLAIGDNGEVVEPEEIEIPDNWIIETKHQGGLWSQNERLCVGRERGFWHLSPIGWAANRDAIKEAWESVSVGMRRTADDRRDDPKAGVEWADFEAWVARWFEKLNRGMDREIDKVTDRLIALREAAAQYELQRRG